MAPLSVTVRAPVALEKSRASRNRFSSWKKVNLILISETNRNEIFMY